MTTEVIFFTVGIPASLIIINYLSKFIIDYKIDPEGIRINYFFGFTIEYTNIVEIKLIPSWHVLFYLPLGGIVLFGSRMWGEEAIMIKTNSSYVNVAIITPKEPVLFLNSIAERMKGDDPNLMAFIAHIQDKKKIAS